MKCALSIASLASLDAEVLVCPIGVAGNITAAKCLGEEAFSFIEKQSGLGNIPQRVGQMVVFHQVAGIAAKRLLLVVAKGDHKGLQTAAQAAAQYIRDYGWGSAVSALHLIADQDVDAIDVCVRAFGVVDYCFDQYKTLNKCESVEISWTIAVERKVHKLAQQALALAMAWVQGARLIKNLGNMPANDCYPGYLGKQAEKLAKQYSNIQSTILKQKEIEALGMGSLLCVAQGSTKPPRFIIMEYKPKKAVNKKPIVLVGKGVTFDSGGISLKPGAGMDEMKFDMCGAATVFGAMKALAEAELPLYVVGLVAAVENMPDGGATRPGDIVTSMSGKTIEVLNTDAEGRLILCDALTYAERYEPKAVIDMATLTGACVIALGSYRAGLLGNDEALKNALFEAGERANDPVWCLPLDPEYKKLLDSPFADLQNIGGREAGTITAAAFLSAFTENYSWAHLDIAGVAWNKGKNKGATARPLALLLEYFKALVGDK